MNFIFLILYLLFLYHSEWPNKQETTSPNSTGGVWLYTSIIHLTIKNLLKSKDQQHSKSTNCAAMFVDVTATVRLFFFFLSQLHCCLSHSLLRRLRPHWLPPFLLFAVLCAHPLGWAPAGRCYSTDFLLHSRGQRDWAKLLADALTFFPAERFFHTIFFLSSGKTFLWGTLRRIQHLQHYFIYNLKESRAQRHARTEIFLHFLHHFEPTLLRCYVIVSTVWGKLY